MSYYIDLGSSTIKVYKYDESLKLLEEHSIYFKNEFDSIKGISGENKKELFAYFHEIKEKYHLNFANTYIFVTGIFRELSQERKEELVRDFNDILDLHFNIISHGIENYYLSKAMENDYNGKKILIINMGGKTTELITFTNGHIEKTHNLLIGVADILNNFLKINSSYSEENIADIEAFVDKKLSDLVLDHDYEAAIFTGGEERFELLTNFKLEENTLFNDNIHHYMCTLDNYIEGTRRVFYEYSLDDLYKLMPGNPKWMDGARAGAIIPLVLFKKAGIKYVIPSDLNLINGVINDQ